MQAGADTKEPSDIKGTEIDALIALVRLDYEHTRSFIDGVVRVSTNLRTIATAGWFALIGAAVQADQGWLALLAAAGAAALGLQDAYHGWLYANARRRSLEQERLLEEYYKFLQRRGQPDAGAELLKHLHNHRFGQRSRIPQRARPGAKRRRAGELPKRARTREHIEKAAEPLRALATMSVGARPKLFYRYLYLPLILAAILIAIILFAGSGSAATGPAAEERSSAKPARSSPYL